MYTWQHDNVKVILYFYEYKNGREYYKYIMSVDGVELFKGHDFGVPNTMQGESLESVMGLLSFLTLKPGDTDMEYFKGYTRKQWAWLDSQECEDIAWLVYDYEDNNG